MSHRLFIGLRPPEDIRDGLLDAMDHIEDARWQNDGQLHVTLRFLGEVSRPGGNELAEALGGIRMDSFDITIDGAGHFERKMRAKAVWARVLPTAPLIQLKRKVDRVCNACGHEEEHRKFLPHITLARLNAGSGPIGDFLAAQADLKMPPFTVREFILFESRLSRHGSHYEPVARYPLG